MKLLAKTCMVLGLVLTGGILSQIATGQSVAESYRKAAKAYRDAADKTTEDKKGCYNEWADYYDCLADQIQSDPNKSCSKPTCKPGE